MSTELVEHIWRTVIQPEITSILGHPLSGDQPPLTTINERQSNGFSLPCAVASYLIIEGRALDAFLQEELEEVPIFPKDLIRKWYPYAPKKVDLCERVVSGASLVNLVREEFGGINEVQQTRLRAGLGKFIEIHRKNRTGFKVINAFTSPQSLAALSNQPHLGVIRDLMVLGGERYKTLYLAAARPIQQREWGEQR